MEIGDKIKVVKDNHSTSEHFVGFVGEVATLTDNNSKMNVGVLFKEEDNQKYSDKLNMIGNDILHFDIDEIKLLTK